MSKPATVEAPKNTLPISIEEELQKQMAALKDQLSAPPSSKVSTKGKLFKLPSGETHPGPMSVVVVDFAWLLAHYKGAFDAKNPQKPDCFAVGREKPESGMLKPHETVKAKYADDCNACPKNQWGSSPTGKGKACKNQRRLAIVPADATKDARILTLYVSPTALKSWDEYVSKLAREEGLLPVQAITEVSFDPNEAYPTLQFKFAGRHNDMETMWSLREKAQDILFREVETA
jgi:hypothetical protein